MAEGLTPPPAPSAANLKPSKPNKYTNDTGQLIDSNSLLQARQNQKKANTVVTLRSGARFHLHLADDGTETLVEDKDLGKFEGYVLDLKPDPEVCQIIPGLFIGSQDASRNLIELKEKKVTHILNAAAGAVDNVFEEDFQYLSLELLDVPEFDITPFFKQSWAFIRKCLKSGGGVLVHCSAGISRSATICISYLIVYHKMSFDQALACVKEARPRIRPNDGFCKSLKALEAAVGQPL